MSLLTVDEPVLDDDLPRSWTGELSPRWSVPAPRAAEPEAPQVEPEDEPSSPRSAAARVADLALTLAAVLGLLVMGVTVTAHVTGLQPLVVRSGSMEPTIETGAMVLVRTVPASELRAGDVVAVDRPDNTRVTHRIVSVEHRGDTAELVLKGDANEDPDPLPVTVSEAGRFVLTTPLIGRVGAFAASMKGGFVLGCIVTAVALPVLRGRRT